MNEFLPSLNDLINLFRQTLRDLSNVTRAIGMHPDFTTETAQSIAEAMTQDPIEGVKVTAITTDDTPDPRIEAIKANHPEFAVKIEQDDDGKETVWLDNTAFPLCQNCQSDVGFMGYSMCYECAKDITNAQADIDEPIIGIETARNVMSWFDDNDPDYDDFDDDDLEEEGEPI